MERLPDRELEIMMVIWHAPDILGTPHILKKLNEFEPRRLQPVQVHLRRLCEKGFVRCEKRDNLNYYYPLIKEDEYKEYVTTQFVDKIYDKSVTKLIASLFSFDRITKEDINEIQEMLDSNKSGE